MIQSPQRPQSLLHQPRMGKVVCASLLWAFVLSAGSWAADLTQEQRQQFLDAHNGYRRDVTPTATNMKKMKWNFDLEKTAGMWADGCVYEHGDPTCSAAPYTSTGQNMFASTASPTPEEAVTAWKDEVKDYTYDTMACTEGEQCGHYTQVVWADSNEVGCGITECTPLAGPGWSTGFLVICNYGPAGNFIGDHPFKSGDSCSECGDLECEDKLCVDKDVDFTIPDTSPESQMECSMTSTAANKTESEDNEDDDKDDQETDKEDDNSTDENNNEDKKGDDDGEKEDDDDFDSGSSLTLPCMLLLVISSTVAFIPK